MRPGTEESAPLPVPTGGENPSFSVIIPTRGRPESLSECLASFRHVRYPLESFEIIVVDDGGEPSAEGIVNTFRDKLNLTFVHQSHGGAGLARNTGACRAAGSIFAFTDDDCVVSPGWLSGFADASRRFPNRALGGKTLNRAAGNPFSAASHAVLDVTHGHWNRAPDEARFFATLNAAFPAEGFRSVGGFDTSFPYAEDRDLCDRWLESGRKIASAPGAEVHHCRRLSFTGFTLQHFRYGRGAAHLHRARKKRNSGGVRPERGLYLDLLKNAAAGVSPGGRVLHILLLLLSQAAYGLGMSKEMTRLRR